SLCLPPARRQRWTSAARGLARFSAPRNTSLNWTMPELVNSRVGSLAGTSGAEGTISWPLPRKNSRNSLRMRAVVYWLDVVMTGLGGRPGGLVLPATLRHEAHGQGRQPGKAARLANPPPAVAGAGLSRRARARVATAREPSGLPCGLDVRVERVEPGRRADGLAVESAPGEQVGGLAPLRQVPGAFLAEPPTHQVARKLDPVALERCHGQLDGLAIEPMGAEFGADVAGTVAGRGAAAHQR